MSKRQFVMLAHTLDESKIATSNVNGWFVSEKMDGLRAFFDGGITRGIPVREVPFANVERDDRLLDPNYKATGLWSRNAKVIRAPDYFLDTLPLLPLDGELYGGYKQWEQTSGTVRSLVADSINDQSWAKISYQVFDSPRLDTIFGNGEIETDIYTKVFDKDLLDWVNARAKKVDINQLDGSFSDVHSSLKRMEFWNTWVQLLPQYRLPFYTKEIEKDLTLRMDQVVERGGEGLMLRKPESFWSPERSYNLLKLKKWFDSEAEVLYYVWGKETNKGSKLLGMMGTLGVSWINPETGQEVRFEVSGFNNSERQMVHQSTGNSAYQIGCCRPGLIVENGIINPNFPIGSKISFRFRDLTAIGLPKNANYYRKPSNL